MGAPSTITAASPLFQKLRAGKTAVWLNPAISDLIASPSDLGQVADAAARFARFAPLLQRIFPGEGWDGVVRSDLIDYQQPPEPLRTLLVKADHALPMSGSIKARGGVHEVLCYVERIARNEALLEPGDDILKLLEPEAQSVLNLHSVAVASTGNLGFSVGLVARAIGLGAEIHMSVDAKAWKKARLVALNAKVVEHDCNYAETVARGRVASAGSPRIHFIDDERSPDLFFGYATAAEELAGQLAARGLVPTVEKPLVVYLPCGVGGAPGGVLFGLKALFGAAVIGVFVEPVRAAAMLAALELGGSEPVSTYDLGIGGDTVADGLAVSAISGLVLERVGRAIHGAVAVPDADLLEAARVAHDTNGLRLEPSAAAGLAGITPFMQACEERPALARRVGQGIHVVWTTGGALLPDEEFERILRA